MGYLATEKLTSKEQVKLDRILSSISKAVDGVVVNVKVIWAEVKIVREERLYRQKWKTFERFCDDVLGYSRRYVNMNIQAEEARESLGTIVPKIPKAAQIKTESQLREVAKVTPANREAVVARVVENVGDGKITAKAISKAAEQVEPKEPQKKKGKLGPIYLTGEQVEDLKAAGEYAESTSYVSRTVAQQILPSKDASIDVASPDEKLMAEFERRDFVDIVVLAAKGKSREDWIAGIHELEKLAGLDVAKYGDTQEAAIEEAEPPKESTPIELLQDAFFSSTPEEAEDLIDAAKELYREVTGKKKNVGVFKKPTAEEVAAYCKERNNAIDPEKFFDYYQTQGWNLANGQKMKDWMAAVRNWERSPQHKEELAARKSAEAAKVFIPPDQLVPERTARIKPETVEAIRKRKEREKARGGYDR